MATATLTHMFQMPLKEFIRTTTTTSSKPKSIPALKPQHDASTEIETVDAGFIQSETAECTTDQKQLIKALAGHLVSHLDERSSGGALRSFEGANTPTIAMGDYVDRLIRYVDVWAGEIPGGHASTGVRCALMAIELVDRLDAPLSRKSVHRVFMCAVLVCVKASEDFIISNRFWAKVGGCDLEELNRMEMAFCDLLQWKITVSREDFDTQQTRFSDPRF